MHLGFSHLLAIIDNFTINMGVQVFMWMYVFISFEFIPRSEIARSYNYSTLNRVTIWVTVRLFYGVLVLFYIPVNSVCGFWFHIHVNPYCYLFNFSYSSEYEVIYHCCLVYFSLMTKDSWLMTVFLPGESPCTEEPGGLQSMGLQRVRHDRVTKHND